MATAEQITSIYGEYLGRNPTQTDINYWLQTGDSIEKIESDISASTEAQLLETSIFDDTTNEENALADTTQSDNRGRFTGTTYDEFLEWFPGSGLEQQMMSLYEIQGKKYEPRPSPGYERNENGRYINSDGEELYFWSPSRVDKEYGTAGRMADADYKTKADIEQSFNSDSMLKESFGNFNNYFSYINQRQDLIDEGVILDPWEQEAQLWDETVINTVQSKGGPNALAIGQVINAERERRQSIQSDASSNLMSQFGIQNEMMDSDGNKYVWSGTGWQLNESAPKQNIIKTLGVAVGQAIMTAALTPLVGPTAASAIASSTAQFMMSGDISIGDSLKSAALGYAGGQFSQAIQKTEIAQTITEQMSNTAGSLSAGSPLAQAALESAGTNVLTQLVTTGEVSIEQAAMAAVMSPLDNALKDLASELDTSEDNLLEEVVVEAKRVGEDLGNGNYLLETGAVINNSGRVVGPDAGHGVVDTGSGYLNIESGIAYEYSIDRNGDGNINQDDLKEITVNTNVYGNTSFDLPSSGGVAYDLSNSEYLKNNLDNLSDDQVILGLQQQGVVVLKDSDGNLYLDPNQDIDPSIASSVSTYFTDRTNLEAQLQFESGFKDYGAGIIVDKNQPYTTGQADNGTYFIAKVDDKGEVSYKAIGSDDYNNLYALEVDAISNGEWNEFQDYLNTNGITSGGLVVETEGAVAEAYFASGLGDLVVSDRSEIDDWLVLDEEEYLSASQFEVLYDTASADLDDKKTEVEVKQDVTTTSSQQESDTAIENQSENIDASSASSDSAQSSATETQSSSSATTINLTSSQAISQALESGAITPGQAAQATATLNSTTNGVSNTAVAGIQDLGIGDGNVDITSGLLNVEQPGAIIGTVVDTDKTLPPDTTVSDAQSLLTTLQGGMGSSSGSTPSSVGGMVTAADIVTPKTPSLFDTMYQNQQQSTESNQITTDQLNALFNQYLGRNADEGAVEFYSGSGMSISDIESSIANSQEAGLYQEAQNQGTKKVEGETNTGNGLTGNGVTGITKKVDDVSGVVGVVPTTNTGGGEVSTVTSGVPGSTVVGGGFNEEPGTKPGVEPGVGPGDGPGDGPGSGINGGDFKFGQGGGMFNFNPFYSSINYQSPDVLPDIIPFGNESSGVQLTRLLNRQGMFTG